MLRGFRETLPLVAAWFSCPGLALISRRPPSNDLGPRFDVWCNCLSDFVISSSSQMEVVLEKQHFQELPRAQSERRLSAAHVSDSIGFRRHRISGNRLTALSTPATSTRKRASHFPTHSHRMGRDEPRPFEDKFVQVFASGISPAHVSTQTKQCRDIL